MGYSIHHSNRDRRSEGGPHLSMSANIQDCCRPGVAWEGSPNGSVRVLSGHWPACQLPVQSGTCQADRTCDTVHLSSLIVRLGSCPASALSCLLPCGCAGRPQLMQLLQAAQLLSQRVLGRKARSLAFRAISAPSGRAPKGRWCCSSLTSLEPNRRTSGSMLTVWSRLAQAVRFGGQLPAPMSEVLLRALLLCRHACSSAGCHGRLCCDA